MNKTPEPTITQLLGDFEGTINRTIIAKRKEKRHTLLRNVALGVGLWALIYVFYVGFVTVLMRPA